MTEPRIDGVHCDHWRGRDMQLQGSGKKDVEHYEDVRFIRYRDQLKGYEHLESRYRWSMTLPFSQHRSYKVERY